VSLEHLIHASFYFSFPVEPAQAALILSPLTMDFNFFVSCLTKCRQLYWFYQVNPLL